MFSNDQKIETTNFYRNMYGTMLNKMNKSEIEKLDIESKSKSEISL